MIFAVLNESQDRLMEFSEIFLSRVVSSCGMMSLARRFPSIADLMKTMSPAHKKIQTTPDYVGQNPG